jgi:hydrogenase maturation protease
VGHRSGSEAPGEGMRTPEGCKAQETDGSSGARGLSAAMQIHPTLIVGYGNPDRGDDGVGFFLVNAVRARLGLRPLEATETGLEDLTGRVDAVFLLQLVPELIETLSRYDRVIFVDAHVGDETPEVDARLLVPHYTLSAFTHHVTPETLLAMVGLLAPEVPPGHLVSIKGHSFDFRQGLSAPTQRLLGRALRLVEEILEGP